MAGCGQRGDLYLPQSPEAAQRTRLPGVVFLPSPSQSANPSANRPASPATAASAPASSTPASPASAASDTGAVSSPVR
nr:lipoprotein [Comamonas serinivorans]